MGRLLRKKKRSGFENSENIPNKSSGKKVINSNRVFCDQTNTASDDNKLLDLKSTDKSSLVCALHNKLKISAGTNVGRSTCKSSQCEVECLQEKHSDRKGASSKRVLRDRTNNSSSANKFNIVDKKSPVLVTLGSRFKMAEKPNGLRPACLNKEQGIVNFEALKAKITDELTTAETELNGNATVTTDEGKIFGLYEAKKSSVPTTLQNTSKNIENLNGIKPVSSKKRHEIVNNKNKKCIENLTSVKRTLQDGTNNTSEGVNFLGFDKVEKSPFLDSLCKYLNKLETTSNGRSVRVRNYLESENCISSKRPCKKKVGKTNRNLINGLNSNPDMSKCTGLDKAESSAWDALENRLELSEISDAGKPTSTQLHLPIYKLNKPSPKSSFNNPDDRLHLYDFEVDENEPVTKKVKKKRFVKIKKQRTYNRKIPVIPSVPINKKKVLNKRNQENICSNTQAKPMQDPMNYKHIFKGRNQLNIYSNDDPKPNQQFGYTPVSPVPDIKYPEVIDNSVRSALDGSFVSFLPGRQSTVYSPPPYQSPPREVNNCVIISQAHDVHCSKSLNSSRCSSKQNMSETSVYSANFTSPIYIGSSTPIHHHWADQSNHGQSSSVSPNAWNKFDISNNFGFEDLDLIEEPIVSPIKTFETPHKIVTPKRPSPVKIPHREVIRMLKFGPDVPEDATQSEESLNIDELLPLNFFHDGDTPNFSPLSSPEPVLQKKPNKPQEQHPNLRPKKYDKKDTSYEKYAEENKMKAVMMEKSNISLTYSPTDPVLKKVRRSYVRPPYLRAKKYDRRCIDEVEEEEDKETEVVTKEKPQPKKKNGLSKKEEIELEKWAKAFNEQCMQVENFDLVVE